MRDLIKIMLNLVLNSYAYFYFMHHSFLFITETPHYTQFGGTACKFSCLTFKRHHMGRAECRAPEIEDGLHVKCQC